MKGVFGWIKRKNSKSDEQAAPSSKIEPVATPTDANESVNDVLPANSGEVSPVISLEPAETINNASANSSEKSTFEPANKEDQSPIIDEEVKLIIEQLNKEGQAEPQGGAQYQSQDAASSQEAPVQGEATSNAQEVVEEPVSGTTESEDTLLRKLRAGFKRSKPDKDAQSDKKISLKTLLGLESSHRGSVPVKVIIGYLPDVLERDAMEYAMGVAERNCEQSSITYFDVFKYDGGFVYEIHEGGRGKAYVPEILKIFDDSGDFDNLKPVKVYIHTAIRTVEVEKLRKGLVAVWLPESKRLETTAGLEPKQDLIPATNQRTGFLVISSMFFIVSFLAMIVAAITQYQPYDPAPDFKYQELEYSKSVSGQWGRISDAVQMGKVVKAVKYEGGVWRALEVEEQAAGEQAASAPASTASSARKE